MVPVGKPWVIVRSCPPHPTPLPKERENYASPCPIDSRFDLGTESAAPSPWGEGWGEGERDRRQTTDLAAGTLRAAAGPEYRRSYRRHRFAMNRPSQPRSPKVIGPGGICGGA